MHLVDNLTLRTAVEAFAATPNQGTYLEVVRNCFQGDLLLDATGSRDPVRTAQKLSSPSPARMRPPRCTRAPTTR